MNISLAHDYDGNSRPMDGDNSGVAQYDIGAYEYTGTYTPPTLQGDLDGNGTVNSLDWSIMNSAWGTADTQSDLNNDGIVNTIDFSIMNSNWSS